MAQSRGHYQVNIHVHRDQRTLLRSIQYTRTLKEITPTYQGDIGNRSSSNRSCGIPVRHQQNGTNYDSL